MWEAVVFEAARGVDRLSVRCRAYRWPMRLLRWFAWLTVTLQVVTLTRLLVKCW